MSPLKIKIPCKNMRENPTNTPINIMDGRVVYIVVGGGHHLTMPNNPHPKIL
jgi:hypothetical protein